MSEKVYRAIIKEGTHLASSNETDGAYRGALLDNETNQIVGQAEWEEFEIDDYEFDDVNENEAADAGELYGALIIIGVSAIGVRVYPHIKKGWNDYIVPTTKKMWSKLMKKSDSAKKCDAPDYINSFQRSLKNYLNALGNEKLTVELVDDFISSIDTLRNSTKDKNVSIKISLNDFAKLLTSIRTSNDILAEEKKVTIANFENNQKKSSDELEQLSNLLKLQKQILLAA